MASQVTNPFGCTIQLNGKNILNGIDGINSSNYEQNVPVPNCRVNGVTIFRPIIYGNISYRLERPPSKNEVSSSRLTQDDNQDWFRWTVYVRGIENEDLSYFIKKAVFYLHDSYTEPIRVIENGPFELTEEGWGQFEIKIEIYFHDIPGLQQNGKTIKQSLLKKKKQKAMNMDIDNDENKNNKNNKNNKIDDVLNGLNGLNGKRSYDEIMSLEKKEITTFELNKNKIKAMIKEKETDLSHIIPSCYDSSNDNKISLIHGLRLFAKDSTEDSKKGIIEETFSEIEFIDPYYSLYERLVLGPHKLIRKHPFLNHWKNKIVNIAEKEQLLIQKISKTHQDLLKKMQDAKIEYQQLCNKQSLQCSNNNTNK